MLLLVAYGATWVFSILLYLARLPNSIAIARRLRAERDAGKYDFKKVKPEHAKIMISADCTTIRQHLMKGTFTSVDLVNFFGERSQRVGRMIECSTEELFESAMDLALKYDAERKAAIAKGTQNDLPFFHGIPISVKELFHMKGMLTTNGCTFLNQRSTFNSLAIQPLFDACAIPIVRGNVPQAGLSIHSENFIWGVC